LGDRRIILATRGSKLALWQANWVKTRLEELGHQVALKVIKTAGDKLARISLVESGTKGMFVKEIEEALAAAEVDVAVHSLKDLPVEQPAGLHVAAVPAREDARDAFISKQSLPFHMLPAGARVGTSSVRRQAQLRHLRADLEFVPLRGNLDTRLRKLERGEVDAVIVAAAGMHRLGFKHCITHYFEIEQVCPAAGQGALAVEIRNADERLARAVAPLDDTHTHQAVDAERALLRHLGGGCQIPIAVHATVEADQMSLVGVVASPDGSQLIRVSDIAPPDDAQKLCRRVADELLRQGARPLLVSSQP